MSTILIRLVDMSIVEIPSRLAGLIPIGAIVINPRVTRIVTSQRDNNNSTGIPGYMNISAGGPDPFGLKKPILSSNKKY